MLRAKQQTGKTGSQLVNVMRLQSQIILQVVAKDQNTKQNKSEYRLTNLTLCL